MTSRELLRQATQIELQAVNDVLEPFGIEEDKFQLPGPYDRKAADEEANAELQEAMTSRTDDSADTLLKHIPYEDRYKIASMARNIHEAARFRRDYNIAIATHKQLMLSSYRILFQRKKKLLDRLGTANAE